MSLVKERFHIRASSEMILSRLLGSLGLAVMAVVQSIYLRQVGFSDASIGYVAAGASLFVVILSPFIPYILEKFNVLKVYLFSIITTAGVYIVMGLTEAIVLATILFFVSRLLIAFLGNSASIAFKDVSGSRKSFTKAQGLMSSLQNLGWVLGPLLGGLVLAQYSLQATFFVGAGFMLLAALIVFVQPIHIKAKKRAQLDSNWVENVRFYAKRKTLLLAYVQRFGVTAWWAFVWTFIPLFMLNEGYSAGAIGISLALTQVPLFLLEFKTVDFIPKFGYRNIFVGSFSLMAVCIIGAAFSPSIPLTVGLLCVASLALCFLEPICEIYFYDQVTLLEEEKAEPIYFTSNSTGSIVMRVLAGLALALSGQLASYLVVGVVMIFIALSALQVQPKKA